MALSLLFSVSGLAASNQAIVYQGRIVRPDGSAITSGFVSFSVSIFSPSPSKCLLYSETQTVSMAGSKGMFSLQIGSGARVDSGAHSFNDVFVNGMNLTSLSCASGTSYSGATTDDRILIVSFNDNGTVVSLAPTNIKSVPFALQAHEIDGWGLNNLVKISSIGSPTTFTTTEMANAKLLTAAGPCSPNDILKWNGTGWACTADATGGSPSDASYAAKGVFQADTDAATSGLNFSSAGVLKVNSGTGANQIVKLDASSRVPAVDGSLLTNLTATNVSSGTLGIARGGTGATTKTAAFDALSPNLAKGDLTVHNGTNNVSVPSGSDGQVLTADSSQATGVKWADAFTGHLPVNRGGTGTGSFAGNGVIVSNLLGSQLSSLNCGSGQVITFDGAGFAICGAAGAKAFLTGGNSFGGDATLGTNDAFTLGFKTSGSVAMTIDTAGKVGFGTGLPEAGLHVVGSNGTTAIFDYYFNGASSAGIAIRKARGTINAPTAVQYGDSLANLGGRGYGATGFSSLSRSAITFKATENWTDVDQGAAITLETTANGTTSRSERMRIDHSGNVGIGTISPTAKLEIKGSGASGTLGLRILRGTGWPNQSIDLHAGDTNDQAIYITGRSSEGNKKMLIFSSVHDGSGSASGANGFIFKTGPETSSTEVLRISESGNVGIGTSSPSSTLTVNGSLARNMVTVTADYAVAPTDSHLVVNKAGVATITLPAASTYPGREISIRTISANSVVSASSNVTPMSGGAAGTAILSATAGKWALLISDGTKWQIQMGN